VHVGVWWQLLCSAAHGDRVITWYVSMCGVTTLLGLTGRDSDCCVGDVLGSGTRRVFCGILLST
jgi:hypothetical protein